MTTETEFLKPKLIGSRFSGHSIPLEVLRDLAVLEEMIIDITKWKYLEDNPDRVRFPRGLTDKISINLVDITDGSAIPVIELNINDNQLFSDHQQYFNEARDAIVDAIESASNNTNITDFLPPNLLAYFDRLGRSLRNDEEIEFSNSNNQKTAHLNKTTRRKLVLSSQVQKITEEIDLAGSIPEADQARMKFEFQVLGGPKVIAPIESQHLDTIIEAFRKYKDGYKIRVRGVGIYDRSNKLQEIESIDHLNILDPLDVSTRIYEISMLKDGWHNEEGKAFSESNLSYITTGFDRYPDDLPLPYIFPTLDNGISIEWSINSHEISLELDFDSSKAEWHNLNITSDDEETKEYDNLDDTLWDDITSKIKQITAK